jgi:hypothetical protein
MPPAIVQAVSPPTLGTPIFEERPAPAGACGLYAAIYSPSLAAVWSSADGAYFVYPSGNTAAMLTEARLIEGRRPATVAESVPVRSQSASQLDRTIAAINQFRVSADGSAKSSALDALRFLDALPKYLPAPKAARGDTGVVTLFWHVDNFYADVEFRGDGKFSVFTRERLGGENRDQSLDEETLDQAAGAWLKTYMAPMFPRYAIATA